MTSARRDAERLPGAYRILERLAVGGSAEVFRGLFASGSGEEEVVVKRLLPQHAGNQRLRRLFSDESKLLSRLDHPGIVRLIDTLDLEGCPALVLEHVDGVDLGRLLGASAAGRLAPGLAAEVAHAVASALAYVDAALGEVVHRDVSPQNVLVSTAGEVKLADFGIAKWAHGPDTTVDGTIKGKLAYLSPEQASGARALDARTDVFALGVVLHEMLFGAPPFCGDSEAEVLARVRACEYSVPTGLASAERALCEILERSIVREPDRRFANAALMRDALSAVLAGRPRAEHRRDLGELARGALTSAARAADVLGAMFGDAAPRTMEVAGPSTSPPALARPPHSRRSHKMAAIAALAVAVAGGASLWYWRGSRGGPTPGLAPIGPPPSSALAGPPSSATPEPARPPIAARESAEVKPAARSTGMLTVNSIPWAHVLLDGRALGTTPLQKVRVPAGSHRLVLRDRTGKTLLSRSVRIEAGRTQVVSYDSEQPGGP